MRADRRMDLYPPIRRRPGRRWRAPGALLLGIVACASDAARLSDATLAAMALQSEGARYRGDVLFVENFQDDRFERRGWYDGGSDVRIANVESGPVSGALECRFERGATGCTGDRPGRHLFEPQDELYFSYWVRYSRDWVGSGRPYHPHEFLFLSEREDRHAGPAWTYFTLYVEQIEGRPQVAFQDGRMVDGRCVLLNDDSVRGCAGRGIADFPFSEERSAAACNGLAGPVQGRDCYAIADDRWYSLRWWRAAEPVLREQRGGGGGWHFVEVYVRLNSIARGRSLADGAIRLWVDGTRALAIDSVLFRTAANGEARLNQLLFAPYIGDGSPAVQTMWIGELTVARGVSPPH